MGAQKNAGPYFQSLIFVFPLTKFSEELVVIEKNAVTGYII